MKGIIGRFQLMLGDYIKMIGIFIAAKVIASFFPLILVMISTSIKGANAMIILI